MRLPPGSAGLLMLAMALRVWLVPVHFAVADSAPLSPATESTSLVDTAGLARSGSAIHLPGITIYGGENKFVEAAGQICLTNGILEFIAVEPEGRDYESLVTLNCRPSALKFALLLIGCEPGELPHKAKPGEKAGDRLRIEVEWRDGDTARRVDVEKLLTDRRAKKPPANLPWVFTGSRFVPDFDGGEVFQADAERAFISLWWNSGILINVDGDYGNPYRGGDQGFEINTQAVPPEGTAVKLIFRKQND